MTKAELLQRMAEDENWQLVPCFVASFNSEIDIPDEYDYMLDDDGEYIATGKGFGFLRAGDKVRVQVDENLSPAESVRLLRKIADEVEWHIYFHDQIGWKNFKRDILDGKL